MGLCSFFEGIEIYIKLNTIHLLYNPFIIANNNTEVIKMTDKKKKKEKPIPEVYPEIDTDLARDNIENDIPYADLQDI